MYRVVVGNEFRFGCLGPGKILFSTIGAWYNHLLSLNIVILFI